VGSATNFWESLEQTAQETAATAAELAGTQLVSGTLEFQELIRTEMSNVLRSRNTSKNEIKAAT